MKSFKVLLRILVSVITILNEEGFKIYDAENQEWYISNIRYDDTDDNIYFDTKEDEIWIKK